jgi:uncharacterized protein YecT (DUF1311 family)
MKHARTLALAIALLAYGAAAAASESTSDLIRRDAPKGISETFYACIDKADSNDIEEAACLSAEQSVQDSRLNRTYKALMAKLDAKAKAQLVESERAWLAFHGKTSRLESTLYGSELVANLQVSQNDIFRLCERVNVLDSYLSLVNDQ